MTATGAPAQTDWSAGSFTVGKASTVIEKVWTGPLHPLADGVTVTMLVWVVVTFAALKLILPVPLAPRPIAGLELVQLSVAPAVPLKLTATGCPPHAERSATGVSKGGWFGEGTVLKNEVYRYNIQALRRSVVAGIPAHTFHWLLDRSIGFNRFVMNQLNERLGQFIAAREIDRLNDPDTRVARSLAALFHPVLYPGVGTLLRITQQELGYLVGLSRQRVNEALRSLQAEGLIAIEYGGLRVLDLPALRRHVHALPST